MLGHMSIWLEDFIIFILFFLDPQNKCHINLISQTKVLVKFWITSLIAYHFPKNFWYVRSHLHLGCSKWISGLRTRFIFNKKRSFWCLVRYQISFSEVAFLPILLLKKTEWNEEYAYFCSRCYRETFWVFFHVKLSVNVARSVMYNVWRSR